MRHTVGGAAAAARSWSARIAVLFVAVVVAACGGGSGTDLSGVTPGLPGTGGDSGSGGGTSTASPSVTLTIVDQASGQATSSVSTANPAVARALVKNASGAPVANALVQFTSSGASAITFSPAATALTDSSGLASVTLTPSSPSAAGAYAITAAATVSDKTVQSVANVSVVPAPVSLGSVAVSVVDQASGEPRNSISFTSLSSVRAVVKTAAGAPVPNALVQFRASDASAITFSPAGTALTDASGLASVTVSPASLTTAGAYAITAATTVSGRQVESTVNVAIGATQVTLGPVLIGQSPLSAYGTTVVVVSVGGVPASTPVPVRFTSTCAALNPARATLTPLVTTVNGVASATYVDKGCGGSDLITATVEGTNVANTATLSIAAPAVTNIQFLSASPQSVVTRGTGGVGLTEVSLVKFRVIDQSNNPVSAPTNVTLSLSNTTGGITIEGGTGPVTRQTDANGEVSVQVRAGTLPTPLWVVASIQGASPAITTNSVLLTVTTGQPTQSKFSMSTSVFNLEGWRYDGEKATLQIIAADIFGTAVPDGTTINFIGDLVGASCRTVAGVCQVDYLSQGERPEDGRITVVAYAVGEESFFDTNGNWRHDPGERFSDLGFVYLDKNENGEWDRGEGIVPFADQRATCVTPDPVQPNLLTRADLGPSTVGACDGAWGLAHIRRSLVLTLSDSFGFFKTTPLQPLGGPSNIPTSYKLAAGTCSVAIPFWLQDLHGNPMPYGTKITAEVVNGSGLSTLVPTDTVASTNALGGTSHVVLVNGRVEAGSPCIGSGTVFIKATTPKGNQTIFSVSVSP